MFLLLPLAWADPSLRSEATSGLFLDPIDLTDQPSRLLQEHDEHREAFAVGGAAVDTGALGGGALRVSEEGFRGGWVSVDGYQQDARVADASGADYYEAQGVDVLGHLALGGRGDRPGGLYAELRATTHSRPHDADWDPFLLQFQSGEMVGHSLERDADNEIVYQESGTNRSRTVTATLGAGRELGAVDIDGGLSLVDTWGEASARTLDGNTVTKLEGSVASMNSRAVLGRLRLHGYRPGYQGLGLRWSLEGGLGPVADRSGAAGFTRTITVEDTATVVEVGERRDGAGALGLGGSLALEREWGDTAVRGGLRVAEVRGWSELVRETTLDEESESERITERARVTVVQAPVGFEQGMGPLTLMGSATYQLARTDEERVVADSLERELSAATTDVVLLGLGARVQPSDRLVLDLVWTGTGTLDLRSAQVALAWGF